MTHNTLQKGSLLQCTILDIIDVPDYEKDHIWATFEKMDHSDLGVDDSLMSSLLFFNVFENDPLDHTLSLSLGYICSISGSFSSFDNFLNHILKLINTTLGRSATPYKKNICSRQQIFNSTKSHLISNLKISSTYLSSEIIDKLHQYEISNWQDAFNNSEFGIIVKYGFNAQAIYLIYLLQSALKTAEELIEAMDSTVSNNDEHRSFHALMLKWVIARLKNTRKDLREKRAAILIKRMGWGNEDPKTLDETGQAFGITRERVRQIERNELLKVANKNSFEEAYFYPLFVVIDSYLQASSGIASLDAVAEHLKKYFKWKRTPSISGLKKILSFSPSGWFSEIENESDMQLLMAGNFNCRECQEVIDCLISFIEEKKSISVNRAVDFVNSFCKEQCSINSSCSMNFTKDFIDYLLLKHLSNVGIKKKNNRIYDKDYWNLKYGRLLLAVEVILRQKKKAMHFTELYGVLKKLRPDDKYLSERTVHATLDRSQDILLWDRGTFIHRDNFQVPLEVLCEIQDWVISKLNNDVPFISVGGVFNNFKRKCKSHMITTETALYTCLREHSHNILVFPKYPKIYLAAKLSARVANSVLFDDFLREAGGAIPYTDLKIYFLEHIGLKQFQLDQLIANEPKALKVSSNKYIHLDNLVFNKIKFLESYENLILSTLNKVGKTGHISIRKAFNDKMISYKNMGIDSVEMLRSLLKIHPSEMFNVERFSHITRSDKKYSQGNVFKTECLKYIRDKNSFCSISELDEYFGKLGYNQQTVWSIRYCDEIFNYLRGAVIHSDSIGWNSDKQSALEKIALDLYYESVKLNDCYGLVDNILESDSLPPLSNNNFYTRLLIADILSKSGNWTLLGNAQNAYTPLINEHKIKSFPDLIYTILKAQWSFVNKCVKAI